MADDLQEEIKKMAEKIPGCLYVSLVGYDGISVAQHINEGDHEITLFDAEISSLMLASRDVKTNLNLGNERELIWLTDKFFIVIYPAGSDYFLYACLKPVGSNPGVARIELNKGRDTLAKILYPQE